MSRLPDRNRSSGVDVAKAIKRAESLLPGQPAADGKRDRRWQAVIRVGQFMDREPEAVLEFVLRWGKHPQRDLRAAIGTCLLEHLLASNFDQLFPRVREAALQSKWFARTFQMCWWSGEAALPANVAKIQRLKRQLHRMQTTKVR